MLQIDGSEKMRINDKNERDIETFYTQKLEFCDWYKINIELTCIRFSNMVTFSIEQEKLCDVFLDANLNPEFEKETFYPFIGFGLNEGQSQKCRFVLNDFQAPNVISINS